MHGSNALWAANTALHTILIAALVAFAAGCSDSPNPTVTVVDHSPPALDPTDDAADDLTIRIDYRDGDGDLGGGVAEVHDCRADGLIHTFDLPAIASSAAVAKGVPISGRLDIWVNDIDEVKMASVAATVCADLGIEPPTAGQAVFCILLVDAAGNRGDGDCTEPIAITTR